MHAVYAFLVRLDTRLDKESLASDAEAEINQYSEDYCDENNWWTAMTLVCESGKLVNLANPGDWRGRDSFTGEFSKIKKEERWSKAIEYTRACILNDVRFAIACATKDWKKEAVEWEDAMATMRKAIAETAETSDSYGLKKLGEMIYQFDGLDKDLPFGDPDSPYRDMRGMHLSSYYDETAGEPCIIFVDIHT